MIEYEDSQNKAAILLEALPYVRRFRGSVFVVKYGGSFMDSPDPAVRSRLLRIWSFFISWEFKWWWCMAEARR